MRRKPFLLENAMWFGGVLAVIVGVTALPTTAIGADRVVLGEQFTATW